MIQDGTVLLDLPKTKGAVANVTKEIRASRLWASWTTDTPPAGQPGSHGRKATSDVPVPYTPTSIMVDRKSPL
ncbi:MAG TPA: hypothetical protein VGS11_01610 [Candidatus Bathyarchaeia archaeon]|nr:hypothetical protein [Candidatus Bathyarchaeia archaeon]